MDSRELLQRLIYLIHVTYLSVSSQNQVDPVKIVCIQSKLSGSSQNRLDPVKVVWIDGLVIESAGQGQKIEGGFRQGKDAHPQLESLVKMMPTQCMCHGYINCSQASTYHYR